MNGWFYLIVAGCFEIGFTTFLKLSQNFTKIPYTIAFAICAMISFGLLNKSVTMISLGTAYAVWTGIGAFGTAVIGFAFFKDPISFGKIFFLSMLIASIVGLKFIAPE